MDEASPQDERPRDRRHLRKWLLLAIVVTVASAVGVVGTSRAAARSLERTWQSAEELTRVYHQAMSDLRWGEVASADIEVEGDRDRDPIARGLTRAYASGLRNQATQAAKVSAATPSTRGLRSDMSRLLRRHADAVDAAAGPPQVLPPPSDPERQDITVAVFREMKRWRLRPSTQPPKATLPPAADHVPGSALVGEPTKAHLVTQSKKDLVAIDIDTGTLRSIDGGADTYTFVGGQGWGAFIDFEANAHDGRAIGHVRLGTADRLLDGPGNETVWLVQEDVGDDGIPTFTLREMDRTPTERAVVKGTGIATGITVNHVTAVYRQGSTVGLGIFERASGRLARFIPGGRVLATHDNAIAWLSDLAVAAPGRVPRLSVLNLATGQERAVAGPSPIAVAASAAFTPDGRSLALSWFVASAEQGLRSSLGIHPVDTLAAPAFVDPDPSLLATKVTWSPAADRLFFLLSERQALGDGMGIGTLKVGHDRAERLPLRGTFLGLAAF